MSNYKKYVAFVLFVILTYLLGYLREGVFITINSVINNVSFPYNRAYITPPEFLYHISLNQLTLFKWLLTLFFFLIFLLVAIGVVHYFFRNRKYNKIVFVVFVTFFVLSFLFYMVGFLTNKLELFLSLIHI